MIFRENINANHLQDSTHALRYPQFLIENGNHEENAHSDPDLSFHGVLAQSVEGLDPQVLLDPLEEELDLPAGLVGLRDNKRIDRKVVCNEYKQLPAFDIPETDSSKIASVVSFGFCSIETNRLVGSQACGLVDASRFSDVVAHVLLGSGHEEGRGHVNLEESLEVHVSAIHDIEGSSFEHDFIENADVVDLSVRNRDEHGDRTTQVDQRMEFDGGFSSLKTGPGKQTHTEVDRGRIQGVDDLVDFLDVGIASIQNSRLPYQDLRDSHEYAPIAVFVGIGDIGSRHFSANSHCVEKLALRGEAGFDVAQALAESELGKGHAKKLIPSRKAFALSGHRILRYTSIELFPMDQFDDLSENNTTGIHVDQSQQGRGFSKSKSNASHFKKSASN